MKLTTFAVSVLAFSILAGGCAGKSAPTTTPTTQTDPVLKAATEAGATVSAVQAAELAYYASGSSHITAADQARIQKAFADVSSGVITAINTYASAKTAANKQALVNAIVTGVNSLVASFAHLSDTQFQQYTAWVNTAVSLIDLVVPGAAAGSSH